MKLSRTKRTKGTQPQWVVEECQVTKPETLHSFMTWVGSPFGGPLVFGETRRVDAYIQNERVTWRTTVEIQPDNVSQSTFDLGGFPFALHITQASTASATAFLHFSHPPLADYAVCERSVQQKYLIKAPPSCLSPRIRLMKSERKSNQQKSKTLKSIQKNTVWISSIFIKTRDSS